MNKVTAPQVAAGIGLGYLAWKLSRGIYKHPIVYAAAVVILLIISAFSMPFGDLARAAGGFVLIFLIINAGALFSQGRVPAGCGVVMGIVLFMGVIFGISDAVDCSQHQCYSNTWSIFQTEKTPDGEYVHSLASIPRNEWAAHGITAASHDQAEHNSTMKNTVAPLIVGAIAIPIAFVIGIMFPYGGKSPKPATITPVRKSN